jgi:hypothetical protein
MRLRHVLVLLASIAATLAFSEGASANAGCGGTLLKDWSDGRIDRVYPVRCYRLALADMPEDIRIYSTARSDIERALQARVRVTSLKSAVPVSSEQGRGVSLWLVAGITAAVLAAGSLLALVR